MQRTVLLTALVAISSLAFGCGRSGQSTEDQAKSIESSAGDQTVKSSGSEASGPADEPQTKISFGKMTAGKKIRQTVECGCAMCMFNMEDVETHELAIMLDGKAWEVTGAAIDPTEHGLCEEVKKAKVVGHLLLYGGDDQEGEFVAESIELQE